MKVVGSIPRNEKNTRYRDARGARLKTRTAKLKNRAVAEEAVMRIRINSGA
jgi:hypothetical protein